MKRKKKGKRTVASERTASPRSVYQVLGISGEILSGEPKIVITGDYLIEIFNHKGIVDLSCEQIQVNTRKCIYKIRGENLMIATVTDDELVVTGAITSLEKI